MQYNKCIYTQVHKHIIYRLTQYSKLSSIFIIKNKTILSATVMAPDSNDDVL